MFSFEKLDAQKIFLTFLLTIILVCNCSAKAGKQSHVLFEAQDSLTQLASKYYGEGNYREALALLSTTDSSTSSPKFLFYIGMSYAALYDFQNAQIYFKKSILGDSANVNYHFQFGRLLLQSGFTNDAVEEFKLCFVLDSTYLPATFQLGLVYNAQKKYPEKEVEIFSFLVRQNPNDFFSCYYLGDALKRLKMVDSGIVFIQKSIELNPQYYPSLLAYANYQHNKQEFKSALEFYQKADSIRPHDKDIVYQIGECLRNLGAYDEALKQFSKAIEIDSSIATYYAQTGYTYFLMEKFDSSIQSYKKAVSIDSANVQYFLNLALGYEKLNSVKGVIESYQQAAQAYHPELISFIYNDLAGYCFKNSLWTEAAKAYKRVIELNPDNLMALYWLGYSYERIPDKESAITTYENYLERTKELNYKPGLRLHVKELLETLKGKKK